MTNKKPYIIGITGGSGSGKTYVIEELNRIFSNRIVIISQDNYYKNVKELAKERWERADYDKPTSFDNQELISDLKKLINGKDVSIPIYDFKTRSRMEQQMKVQPEEVIIVEGLFIFDILEIRKLLDLKIYLNVDPDVRLARRLLRDIRERGETVKNLDQSISWYLNVVKPRQEKYIVPTKKFADMVIDVNDGAYKAVDILKEKVRAVLTKNI